MIAIGGEATRCRSYPDVGIPSEGASSQLPSMDGASEAIPPHRVLPCLDDRLAVLQAVAPMAMVDLPLFASLE